MTDLEPCLQCQLTGGGVAALTSAYFFYHARRVSQHRAFLALCGVAAGSFSVYYALYVPLFSPAFHAQRAAERRAMQSAPEQERRKTKTDK